MKTTKSEWKKLSDIKLPTRFQRFCQNLRTKLFWVRKDFVKFLRYGLWLNLTGKQNSVEYIIAYFSAVANPLIKIAFYGGDDRAQKVEQWKHIVDNHLKNISFMGRNCDEKLLHYWRHWHLQPKNQLNYKDYIYAIESCRIDLFKAQSELMLDDMEDSIDAQNISYKQKRKKILALHNMGAKDLADKAKFRNMIGSIYIREIICNLLKDECKAIMQDSYESPYNGINPNNPHYLQLLGDSTNGGKQ